MLTWSLRVWCPKLDFKNFVILRNDVVCKVIFDHHGLSELVGLEKVMLACFLKKLKGVVALLNTVGTNLWGFTIWVTTFEYEIVWIKGCFTHSARPFLINSDNQSLPIMTSCLWWNKALSLFVALLFIDVLMNDSEITASKNCHVFELGLHRERLEDFLLVLWRNHCVG